MTRTVETIVNDIHDRHRLSPPHPDTRARVCAIDDVLDIVRVLLYEANSHAAELRLIDSLREPMGRVDGE